MTRGWLWTRLALVGVPLVVLAGGVYLGASTLLSVVVAACALAVVTVGLVRYP